MAVPWRERPALLGRMPARPRPELVAHATLTVLVPASKSAQRGSRVSTWIRSTSEAAFLAAPRAVCAVQLRAWNVGVDTVADLRAVELDCEVGVQPRQGASRCFARAAARLPALTAPCANPFTRSYR